MPLLMCARCLVNVRAHQWTGCLCEQCEDAIEGMTQTELDADFEAHTARPVVQSNNQEASR